ncbi:MAG: S8 family serine peptidase [Frankiaceae bacterium]|nr:S8 family serine peptidase [Frankiaceae bacterium]
MSAAAVVGASFTPLLGLTPAQADTHRTGFAKTHKSIAAHAAPQLDSALARLHGDAGVDVMIQMTGKPSVVAWAHPASGATSAAARAAANKAQAASDVAQQSRVASSFRSPATKATVLYRTHVLYNGIAVHTTAGRLRALSHLPGVLAIHKLVTKHVDNSVTVPLIGAPAVWNSGNTGTSTATSKTVRVGIIDTGIDYTHADFGGEGTTAAYNAAKANDTTAPATFGGGFDGSKVVGGYDFVGDAYDASVPAKDVPQPDPNPLDCNSHGTHVAGTTAGLGVLQNGSTYSGPYNAALDESQFHIGPGVAPGASLYALKIFGCDGSTNVIASALDWAADPNGDGDLSDHLDVVNMSLGSDYSSSQDPDAVAANNASLAGVTVVAASGNGGDLFDIGGAPGNAVRAIGVAASDDSQDIVDALQVDAPNAIAGNYPGLESAKFDWASAAPVSGDLATTGDITQPPSGSNDTDGCDPLPAGSLTGKIAYLYWTDTGTRRCGSAGRTNNVEAAGAIGAVFFDDVNGFTAGINGNADIPAMLISKDAGDTINAQLANNQTVTVTLTYALHNLGKIVHPETTDTVASFSSRGIGEAGNVKPDVTAPGVTVFSAGMGTGTDGLTDSGTSMATPHVAGVAALVKAAHPSWTPEQIKASIMNTAGQDVCDSPRTLNSGVPVETACPGANLSPERVGAGRVQADKAAANQTLAMVDDNSGAVSVSFGTLDASSITSYTRTIKVTNYRTVQTVQYVVSYDAIDDNPGATYSVSPSEISLAPGQSQVVTVKLTVDPSQLVSRPEQSLVHDGQASLSAGPAGQPSFVSDASGRVLLTPASRTADEAHLAQLRVPVYAAPRPASTMTQASAIALNNTGAGTLLLTGNGVDVPAVNATDKHRRSVADVFELQGSSDALPNCSATQISGCVPFTDDRAGDLKYVGFSSDVPSFQQFGDNIPQAVSDGAQGYFGIATQGPWRTPSNYEEYDVLMLNGNGDPVAVTFNTRLTGLDQFVAETLLLNPDGSTKKDGNGNPIADLEPINNSFDGVDDTNVFNSDVLTMPVWLDFLAQNGVIDPSTPGGTRLSYLVDAFTESSGFTDSIGDPLSNQTLMSVDLAQPELWAGNINDQGPTCQLGGYCTTLLDDQPGVQLAVAKNAASAADGAQSLLVFHHDNVDGNRAQVVSALNGTKTTLSVAHNPAVYGQANSATVTVAAIATGLGVPAGTVKVFDGSKVIAQGALSSGHATLALPTRTVGTHQLIAQYFGSDSFAQSASSALALTVKKASSKTTLTSSATKVKAGTAVTLKALTSVLAPGNAPVTGTVTFWDGAKKIGTYPFTGSKSITSAKLAKGTHVFKAVYSGSGVLLGSTGTVTVVAS